MTTVEDISVSMIVRRGDGGVYTCHAYNFLGSDSSTISITVQCKFHVDSLSSQLCNYLNEMYS